MLPSRTFLVALLVLTPHAVLSGGPENDTCETAVLMQGPGGPCEFIYEGTTEGAADDYDPYDPGSGESCTGAAQPGADVTFYADIYEGGILWVWVTDTWPRTPSVYVVTDCADVPGSCVAGDRGSSGYAQVQLLDLPEGRYYVIVDSEGSEGDYVLAAIVNSFATAAEGTTWSSLKSFFR